MKTKLGFAILCAALPLLAHHSFELKFDRHRPLTLTGVVTKVEWINPHTQFYVDVKDESGKVVSWTFETAPPSALIMRGWQKDSMKVGDTITVHAYGAKDGTNFAAARQVTFGDGRTVFGGSMEDKGPPE